MSITLFRSGVGCYTNNLKVAEKKCNIVELEQVFVFYFTSPTTARFHFYAEKKYEETQSKLMFIPLN